MHLVPLYLASLWCKPHPDYFDYDVDVDERDEIRIPPEWICDGEADCNESEDEEGCEGKLIS